MMSVTRSRLAAASPASLSAVHTAWRSGLADMRQHEVLRMGRAQLVEAVALGEIGHEVHLLGGDVAGISPDRLEADVDDRIAGRLVRDGLAIDPQREIRVRAVDLFGQAGLERRRREVGGDAVVFGLREVLAQRDEVLEFLFDLAAELLLAQFVDEDLHPLLVDVVAPRVAVPDAQHRLQIGEKICSVGRNSRIM